MHELLSLEYVEHRVTQSFGIIVAIVIVVLAWLSTRVDDEDDAWEEMRYPTVGHCSGKYLVLQLLQWINSRF